MARRPAPLSIRIAQPIVSPGPTCATGESACCICAAFPGRAPPSWSASATANTHTHVLVDEPELDYAALVNGESVFGALIALETCETIVLPTGGRRE